MPATWSKNTVTNQAMTMMNHALGVSAITFTKAVMITDDITKDTVSQLQALTTVNYKQTRVPRVISTEDDRSRVGVTIDNSDVNEDYTYYGVALYGKQNSTNEEILFSVIPLTTAATMVANENNVATSSIYLDIYTDIVRGTQVTIMVSNSGTLSREDVQQMISQSIGNALNYPNETASIGTDLDTILDISITRIINDTTVVHAPSGFSGTGYLITIGSGDKTVPIVHTLDDTINNIRSTRYFNSTTNVWSEWNAYAKTVDVNQQLDKKVNVADMRKPASDVAGIEEVNAKQDKISYTPADDSKVVHTSGDEEIAGTKTFDTAPIDKTTGNPYITAKAPGIPKLAVTYNATSKAFDYTLTAPEKDGLSDIIQYNLLWKDHSVDDWTRVIVKPDALTGQLTGVDITKTYDFKAAAQNAVGSSDSTDVITLGTAAVPGIPSLTVEYNAGKKGFDYTVTAPESDGGSEITGYSLEYQKQGGTDWTKVALNPDSLTGTVTDGIEVGSNYLFRVNAENAVGSSDYFTVSGPVSAVDGNIYGVSWDGSSSGALKRTDAAVGLKAGINGAQNDFDNVGPWKGMHRVTDSMNNVFVRVPKFYIRKTQTGAPANGTATWQVSLVSHGDDWYLPKGFWDFTNSKELDYIDIGAYDATGSSSKLTSVAGKTPLVNLSIAKFRSAAKANGTDYQIWDIHAWDMLQVLFIIEFATLNSQSVMEGVDSGSSAANSGVADSHKGSSGTAGSGSNAMSYRGIENLYGNVWKFCDGVNFKDNQPWVCEDATNYQSDLFASPYVRTSYTATSDNANNYIKALGFDSVHPYAQFTTDDSGSESTYYADYDWPGSGNTILGTSGGWSFGAGVGLFYSARDGSSTAAYADGGCRLLKKALP